MNEVLRQEKKYFMKNWDLTSERMKCNWIFHLTDWKRSA